MVVSTVLTAFNDNAAITFLASMTPNFTNLMKYAVVAGAVTGGGLTVIANAPNPLGQALLSRYFPEGIRPTKLFLAAALPTLIVAITFWLLRPEV
jgi:Na+/H+ antiporter NhaD/arsenite permease-like protein